MNRLPYPKRYNQPIPHMGARTLSSLRLGWLASFLVAVAILPSSLHASSLEDTARQFANKIASAAGPGAFGFEISNRSSLDEKSVREIANILNAQLNADNVRVAALDPLSGTIEVFLSENLRDYVWTAKIKAELGSGKNDERVVLISLPLPPSEATVVSSLPMVIKATPLFSQQQPMLDLALAETSGGARLIVLNDDAVVTYRHPSNDQTKTWQLETSLPINFSHSLPRDLRGRLLLRRDHLFDVYLPGTFCQSSSGATVPPGLSCQDSAGSDLWPLTSDDAGVRAFFATSRNFFTGSLSPAIGKIANVPSFYSAAALPSSISTFWIFAAVDGSAHFVDGFSDQVIPGSRWGSDLAGVRSGCGLGSQLLVSESSTSRQGNSDAADSRRDSLRAYEFHDREPVAVSPPIDFDGSIVTLWAESSGQSATAIVKNKTGWYEAYRVSLSCN